MEAVVLMLAVANAMVDIYDAQSGRTDLGDTISASQQIATVRAVITERTRTIYDPASERSTVVRYYGITLPYGSPVELGYRLVDKATGTTYQIDYIVTRKMFIGFCDVELECRTVT